MNQRQIKSAFILSLLFPVCLFLVGCSSTRRLTTDAVPKLKYPPTDGKVTLASGWEMDAKEIWFDKDSVTFVDKTGIKRTIAAPELRRIDQNDRFGGVMFGLMTGAAIGGGVPFLLSTIDSHMSYGEAYSIMGGLGLGVIIGTTTGAISGHHTVYEFVHEPSAADSTDIRQLPPAKK